LVDVQIAHQEFDPNLLPLGHYLLFAMADGIPSKGVVVQVAASK